jgi:sugar lactone lactonase YvrE
MKYYKSKLLVEDLVFPECPRWRNDRLWFSNIFANQVMSIDANGKIDTILNIPAIGIGWMPDDSFIFVELKKSNQKILQYKNGKVSTVCDNLNHLSDFMFNDLVVSSKGFAYTGNTGCNAEKSEDWNNVKPAPIALIKNGIAKIVAENLICPNGIIITPDEKKLIVAEPNAHRLTSFSIAEDGSLFNRNIFAQLEDHHNPDGICLDKGGAVWAASGTECVRVIEGGEITHTVKTIGKTALACMLGGSNRQTLFICTKSMPTYNSEDFKKSKTGRIELIEVDTPPGAGKP